MYYKQSTNAVSEENNDEIRNVKYLKRENDIS